MHWNGLQEVFICHRRNSVQLFHHGTFEVQCMEILLEGGCFVWLYSGSDLCLNEEFSSYFTRLIWIRLAAFLVADPFVRSIVFSWKLTESLSVDLCPSRVAQLSGETLVHDLVQMLMPSYGREVANLSQIRSCRPLLKKPSINDVVSPLWGFFGWILSWL